MKKETIIGLSLAGILLAALGGLTIYLFLFGRDLKGPEAGRAESEAEAVLAALQESADASDRAAREKALQQAASAGRFLIWVGDSRTVGMQEAMQNDNLYIAAAGEGYEWFSSEGLPLLERALLEHPGTPVIFNLGVNDYDNMSRYLTLYEQIIATCPDTDFYFLSVNPIDPEICKNITNEEISDFNAHLKLSFPDSYIDSYTWMMAEDIKTFDGIHYDEEAYRSLYQYVTQQLQRLEATE